MEFKELQAEMDTGCLRGRGWVESAPPAPNARGLEPWLSLVVIIVTIADMSAHDTTQPHHAENRIRQT